MAEEIRWGIIGTGNIARQFARGLAVLPDAELAAVGSRTAAAAGAFAEAFDVPHRHSSYEDLAQDPDVDAVYIATPHPLHRENTLLCLRAGKAVLCEKPFAINAAEAEEMIRLAREKGLLLMEAMWSRFFPAMAKVRELLAAGAIGQVSLLTAEFGFRARFDPSNRLFNPALGGGALLDVGVYTVSLASMVFGSPSRVTGLAHLGSTGVDEQAGIILSYEGGQLAVLATAIRTATPQEAMLMGSDGHIRIHPRWWMPTRLTLSVTGREDEVFELPFTGNGYNYEAAEVMACLRAGKLESEVMLLDETLSIMRTLDQLRAQWGLKYPME
ncbi:MAG: Gfo/Idh/MocA family oxidoreductase [Anaerolineae bacterium]|nr:MAG: Gfo/Idh/MocA family oxidoreductase [Anaerolineae bacterium]